MIQQPHFWVNSRQNWKQKDIYAFMFMAAFLTRAQRWKQFKCPSAGGWINTVWSTHPVEYYLALKGGKFWHSDVDEPWEHYAVRNNPDTKKQILYDSTYMRYLKQSNSDSRMMATRECRVERSGELLNRCKICFARQLAFQKLVAQQCQCT